MIRDVQGLQPFGGDLTKGDQFSGDLVSVGVKITALVVPVTRLWNTAVEHGWFLFPRNGHGQHNISGNVTSTGANLSMRDGYHLLLGIGCWCNLLPMQ